MTAAGFLTPIESETGCSSGSIAGGDHANLGKIVEE